MLFTKSRKVLDFTGIYHTDSNDLIIDGYDENEGMATPVKAFRF
jgi:hypothetical protein